MNNNITSSNTLQQYHITDNSHLEELINKVIKTADTVLGTDWPELVWAVPGILPVGLIILAGAPKVGKSRFALQLTQAVATGGEFLGQKVESGSVLYLAFEDPPKRLKNRMEKLHWPEGLDVDFFTVGDIYNLETETGMRRSDLINYLINRKPYRLVVIDTLSRGFLGKQNEVDEMTRALTPIQESAHKNNCAIVIIDHHRKVSEKITDAISDILGSTAKGAMADTVIGLYKGNGNTSAKNSIIGRDVEEIIIDVKLDKETCHWQLNNESESSTGGQMDVYDVLMESKKPLGPTEIGKELGRNRGTVRKQLGALEQKGLVQPSGTKWTITAKEETPLPLLPMLP